MKNIKEVFREIPKSVSKEGPHPNRLKYHLTVEWPPTCRNRSVKTLKSRPDLVHQMNEYTKKVIAFCNLYKHPIQIDQNYNILGIRVWWKDGGDLYHFLTNLSKQQFYIIPEIAVVNPLSQKLILFKIEITDQGITVF